MNMAPVLHVTTYNICLDKAILISIHQRILKLKPHELSLTILLPSFYQNDTRMVEAWHQTKKVLDNSWDLRSEILGMKSNQG